jgi:hypothetical protein
MSAAVGLEFCLGTLGRLSPILATLAAVLRRVVLISESALRS